MAWCHPTMSLFDCTPKKIIVHTSLPSHKEMPSSGEARYINYLVIFKEIIMHLYVSWISSPVLKFLFDFQFCHLIESSWWFCREAHATTLINNPSIHNHSSSYGSYIFWERNSSMFHMIMYPQRIKWSSMLTDGWFPFISGSVVASQIKRMGGPKYLHSWLF